jgi:hypothetical protein
MCYLYNELEKNLYKIGELLRALHSSVNYVCQLCVVNLLNKFSMPLGFTSITYDYFLFFFAKPRKEMTKNQPYLSCDGHGGKIPIFSPLLGLWFFFLNEGKFIRSDVKMNTKHTCRPLKKGTEGTHERSY